MNSTLLQNKVILLFDKSSIISLVTFLVLFFNCTTVFSQSEPLNKHIQEDLKKIKEQLENKEYDQALVKIEGLESFKNYIAIDSNRLNLAFLKAESYYGNKEQEKAINLLLKRFSELKGRPKLYQIHIKYSFFIAKIFKSAQDYSKSREYYKIILNNSLLKRDTVNVLKSYQAIGSTFYSEEKEDSATYYYNKIIAYPVTKTTNKGISNAYNNLSVIAEEENNLIQAEEYINMSLKIIEQQKDTINIARALMNVGNISYSKKEFDNAKINYLKAYEAVKNKKSNKAIKIKEFSLYNLSYVSEELKDFEMAYSYLEEAIGLTDSLARINTAQNISEIAAKYNVAKEAEKTAAAESKHLRAQVFFYGLAIAFLTFIVLAYAFYRNYRLKQHNRLEQVENELHTKIINATIDAKEKERKTIAEILHDSVSALLSSANLHLQASKAQLKKDAPKEISKAQMIVNEASIKIRDLSHELISSVLLKFGLAFAVHDMCQKYSNSEISLLSDDDGIKRYDQDFEIKIHNIIEELINNILKHSKASNAIIKLTHREDDMLSVRINDDGVGFDIEKVRSKDGLGLSHINARIKVMKGVFNIVTSKGEGTSIFILVPIKLKDEEV